MNAAVVGLGVGEQHARAYGAALRWVCDLDAAKARRLADELNVGVATFDQILRDPQTHVVSIASYDDVHAAQIVEALRAGKQVFAEKPLCRTRAELDAIRAVSNGRRLGCNLVLRAAPLYRWLRGAIAAGELGTIYAFDGDYLFGRIEKITHGWRKDVVDYSVMQGGGVHLVDLMLWLTDQRPARVIAAGNRIATTGTAFRYNDFAAATFTFAGGLIGRITANFGSVHRHQHVVRVFGTKATFLYDDQGARLCVSRDGTIKRIDLAPEPPTKGALIPEFLAGGGAETRHEFDVVLACLAADEALAAGASVEVA